MRTLFIIIFIPICFFSFGQSKKELDELCGFKEFKLLTSVSDYKSKYQIYKKHKDVDGLIIYSINALGYGIKLGDGKITEIELYTIQDTIYKCTVKLSYCELETISSAFGEPNVIHEAEFIDKYHSLNWPSTDKYVWEGNKVKLVLEKNHRVMKQNYFGEYYFEGKDYDELIFVLIDSMLIKNKIKRKNSKTDLLSEFNTPLNETKNIVPCTYNTHKVDLLNQEWCTGDEICLRYNKEPYGTQEFNLGVAKNYSNKILYISCTSSLGFFGGEFRGNLEIILNNGEKIICHERNLRGSNKEGNDYHLSYSVYYLTENEYEKLSEQNICCLKIIFEYNNSWENYFFENVNSNFKCTIDGLSDCNY